MPFYTRRMAIFLAQEEKLRNEKQKEQPQQSPAKVEEKEPSPPKEFRLYEAEGFEERKVKLLRDMLHSQVQRIKRVKPSIPIDTKFGRKYTILTDEILIAETPKCKVYKTKHADYPDNILAAKVYTFENEKGMQAELAKFRYKILRHIGKKHPYIIQTWEVFHQQNTLIVIQEYANKGSLAGWLNKKGPVTENQAGKWVYMLARALDYLGDIGVCHRDVKPENILLNHKELKVKLAGFEHAILYFDTSKDEPIQLDVQKKIESDEPPYQAPESFRESGVFDPVSADVWSVGACLYTMLTKNYPYDYADPQADINTQISGNIAALENVSTEGKFFLAQILKTNPEERLTINKILQDTWTKSFRV